jgi:hypothetical protein
MLDTFTIDTFAPLAGSSFALAAPDGQVAFELIEVRPRGDAPDTGIAGQRAPFSLLFLARSLQTPLPQGSYAIEHDELGDFELFVVPVARDGDGVRYEAVFG